MIKYSLICDQGHTFESWFSNAEGYETQVKRGFVECPACQSKQVTKALMAPSVSTSRRKEKIAAQAAQIMAAEMKAAPEPAPTPAPASESQPMALLDEGQQAMRNMLREMHRKMTENSTDVGDRFVTEARDMQSGEIPTRAIHGRASLEDAKALLEEGIPVLPLPALPDERN